MKSIGIIVGSLREKSFNKSVAKYVLSQLTKNYNVQMIDISKLPLYNPDFDSNNTLTEWTYFRSTIKTVDAFLFVTPEYNRSFPASIKNALDVGSRPYINNIWNSKPAAVISVSTGKIGGFGANNHLRQTLAFLNLFVMPQPEAYVGEIEESLDEKGEVSSDRTKSYLNKFSNEFDIWIKRF